MTTNLNWIQNSFYRWGTFRTELTQLLDLAIELKENPIQSTLKNKTIAIMYEKPSLRTRVSFSVGIQQLGGQVIEITSAQKKKRGTYKTRFVFYKVMSTELCYEHEHEILETMAEYSNSYHQWIIGFTSPCQILDLQTLQRKFPRLTRT